MWREAQQWFHHCYWNHYLLELFAGCYKTAGIIWKASQGNKNPPWSGLEAQLWTTLSWLQIEPLNLSCVYKLTHKSICTLSRIERSAHGGCQTRMLMRRKLNFCIHWRTWSFFLCETAWTLIFTSQNKRGTEINRAENSMETTCTCTHSEGLTCTRMCRKQP